MVKNSSQSLEIHIQLLSLEPMRFSVSVWGRLENGPAVIVLEALTVGNGVTVTDMQVEAEDSRPQSFTVSDNQLHIPISPFYLCYTVQSQYQTCVGADRRAYFTYPFANLHEFFIGTGVLPYPVSLPEIAEQLRVEVMVAGLPDDWQLFSNGFLTDPHPAKLDSFFLYAAPVHHPTIHRYRGQGDEVTFQLLVQRGRELPHALADICAFLDETLAWLEQHLAPYRQAGTIHILFLQAAADFAAQTNNLAFATGENVLNGIITYAPNDPAYLDRLFGQADYATFLLDGLAHELVHTYTTTAWQGRYKAVLYPSSDCPVPVSHLLGEALAGYIHRLYLRQRASEGNSANFPPGFIAQDVAYALEQQKKRGRNHPFLDLFLFDQAVHQQGCTLLALVGEIMHERQLTHQPYADVDFLCAKLTEKWGVEMGERGRDLLLPMITPDYAQMLKRLIEESPGFR